MKDDHREFYYKNVSMSIEVPDSNYCCGYDFDKRCKYYIPPTDNNNILTCMLGFSIVSVDLDGRILKPKRCKTLKQTG